MGNHGKLITWFEIPVKDFNRAKEFYEEVLGVELEVVELDKKRFGVFPSDPVVTGGAIVAGEGYVPSSEGLGIFFEAAGSLDAILDRVVPAGGRIAVPKYRVNAEIGDVAVIQDIEGNRIGLHSR